MTSHAADWFISHNSGTSGVPRIFCFPHAGGNPRAFLDWQPGLDGDAEILAVCRPGREHRAAEPAPTIEEFIAGASAAIADLTAADGRPGYLFGHSLGALIAFEVCRRLTGTPAQPRAFVAAPDMRALLLPGVIADFRMAVGYRYQAGSPLAVPATLVVGRDDPHVKA